MHVGMVFLHVAPSNTVTKQHGQAIDEWIYPEFEQNWKLFAPNPLQQNIAVQVRADVRAADGEIRTTRWYDLSALDGAAIDGNLLPSHTQQNELRRAWDFFVATHDNANRPNGLRGSLSEKYLRRIVVLRLDREQAGRPGRGRATGPGPLPYEQCAASEVEPGAGVRQAHRPRAALVAGLGGRPALPGRGPRSPRGRRRAPDERPRPRPDGQPRPDGSSRTDG